MLDPIFTSIHVNIPSASIHTPYTPLPILYIPIHTSSANVCTPFTHVHTTYTHVPTPFTHVPSPYAHVPTQHASIPTQPAHIHQDSLRRSTRLRHPSSHLNYNVSNSLIQQPGLSTSDTSHHITFLSLAIIFHHTMSISTHSEPKNYVEALQ